MRSKLIIAVLIALSFAIDRGTKILVVDLVDYGSKTKLIGSVLELRHVHNYGIAFGLFSSAGKLVLLGTILVGIFLMFLLFRISRPDPVTSVGTALLAGGALGNLYDRSVNGYVVDFIHLPKWPTFNFADVFIVLGVALLILAQFREARREFT